jgi:hypothetical protein
MRSLLAAVGDYECWLDKPVDQCGHVGLSKALAAGLVGVVTLLKASQHSPQAPVRVYLYPRWKEHIQASNIY